MSTTIKGRFVQKHDIESNWNLATNFIPLEGEVIIYEPDATHSYPRFKVGDGTTLVSALPFADAGINNINDKKINLPETDGTVNYGTVGQFAVSDGAGGITWQTINNGDEVNY